jgi:hypothetical protein
MKILNVIIGLFLIGGVVVHADDSKEVRLKKKIGFEQKSTVMARMGPNEQVVVRFPDVQFYPRLGPGWSMPSNPRITAPVDGKFVSQHIRCKKGAERLSVYYANFGANIEAARNQLIKEACNNSLFDSIHSAGPSDIGDLSLTALGQDSKEISFVIGGLLVTVEAENSTFDVLDLARWIQSQLTIRPVSEISNQFPAPTDITIKKIQGAQNLKLGISMITRGVSISPQTSEVTNAKIGEPLVIRVNPPVGTDANRYELEQKMGESFEPVGMEGLGHLDRAIKPIKPGGAIYKYVLIDRQTLLSYPGEIKIDVHP